jgi:hypothetical protein
MQELFNLVNNVPQIAEKKVFLDLRNLFIDPLINDFLFKLLTSIQRLHAIDNLFQMCIPGS